MTFPLVPQRENASKMVGPSSCPAPFPITRHVFPFWSIKEFLGSEGVCEAVSEAPNAKDTKARPVKAARKFTILVLSDKKSLDLLGN